MQEFEVPEAKEPASMPIAGIFPCRDLVIRRAGGLEARSRHGQRPRSVIRRAGGLEVFNKRGVTSLEVIRRAGGLEVDGIWHVRIYAVIRRAGGLEGVEQKKMPSK